MFATLLALSLRSLGIPARVIDGYYGGDWDRIGHFLLIRKAHAHSWVEAWINGRWYREDGTPASRWTLSGVRFPMLDAVWETVKLGWYSYVLEFQNADRGRLVVFIRDWLSTKLFDFTAAMAIFSLVIWGMRRLKRFHLRPRRPSWPLLDAWMRKRGWFRPVSMPLRSVPLPREVSPDRWKHFVKEWEAQAFGAVKPWPRHDLRANLRALSKARW